MRSITLTSANMLLRVVLLLTLNISSTECKKLGVLDSVLGALGSTVMGMMKVKGTTDAACNYYKCPKGEVLISKVGHVPHTNGCGSFGVKINLSDLPLLEKCCNTHDICYETCGESRLKCDEQLKHCAQKVCLETSNKLGKVVANKLGKVVEDATLPACSTLGDMMFQTTNFLGCSPFTKAQEAACKCIRKRTNRGNYDDEL